jgi:hypothetical protein
MRVALCLRGVPAWLYIYNQARVYKSPSRLRIGVLFLVVQVDITCESSLSSPYACTGYSNVGYLKGTAHIIPLGTWRVQIY